MATCTYNLSETIGAGMEARYFVNGIRVSREKFNELRDRAHDSGTLNCFSTRAWPIAGGKTRRTNYSVASFSY